MEIPSLIPPPRRSIKKYVVFGALVGAVIAALLIKVLVFNRAADDTAAVQLWVLATKAFVE